MLTEPVLPWRTPAAIGFAPVVSIVWRAANSIFSAEPLGSNELRRPKSLTANPIDTSPFFEDILIPVNNRTLPAVSAALISLYAASVFPPRTVATLPYSDVTDACK